MVKLLVSEEKRITGMDKEKIMEENTLIRKEIVTYERQPDGRIKVSKVIDQKMSEKSDRMITSHEVVYL